MRVGGSGRSGLVLRSHFVSGLGFVCWMGSGSVSAAIAIWARAALLWVCGLYVCIILGVLLRLEWWVAAVLYGFVSLGISAVLLWVGVLLIILHRFWRAARLEYRKCKS